MPRRLDPNRDLRKDWKVSIPATLAGRVEFALHDRITQQTKYGARNRLLSALLSRWLAEQSGTPPDRLPPVPSIEELMVQ